MFHAEIELVRIVATVTGADGAAVAGLNKEDFSVAEDSIAQEIAVFARDEDTPLSIVMAIDVSGSMAGEFGTRAQRTAAVSGRAAPGYYPSRSSSRNTVHTLRVTTRDLGYLVRSRKLYVSP